MEEGDLECLFDIRLLPKLWLGTAKGDKLESDYRVDKTGKSRKCLEIV